MSVRFLPLLGPIVLASWLSAGCSEAEGKATEVVVNIEADPSVGFRWSGGRQYVSRRAEPPEQSAE